MPGAWASSVARMVSRKAPRWASQPPSGREGANWTIAERTWWPAGARPSSKAEGRTISMTGASEKRPYLTGLKASSTARAEGAITRRVRRSAPRKSGAPVSARCSLAAVPRMRIACDAPDEAGVEVAGAEQVEEGGARVDRRDGGAREDHLAVVEADAHHPVVRDLERGDAGAGADGDAPGRDRLRHRIGDGAHAALRQREAGGVAGGLAGEAVEQQHQRVRRARPHPGAEHGVVGEDALQPVVGRARRRARRRRSRAGRAGTRAGRRGPWRGASGRASRASRSRCRRPWRGAAGRAP